MVVVVVFAMLSSPGDGNNWICTSWNEGECMAGGCQRCDGDCYLNEPHDIYLSAVLKIEN